MTLVQDGQDVVATGSGTINTTDSESLPITCQSPVIDPNPGGDPNGLTSVYKGDIAGLANFGSGGNSTPSSSSGDFVGIDKSSNQLDLPEHYISGAPLTSIATWNDTTIEGPGVTPCTYVWKWGSGDNTGTFTLKAGEATVPEPATLGLMVIGLLGAGFAGRQGRN